MVLSTIARVKLYHALDYLRTDYTVSREMYEWAYELVNKLITRE